MKRLPLILIPLLLLALPLQAQSALKDALSLLRSGKSVSCRYTYEMKGDFPLKGKGEAVLQGKMFRTEENGLESRCDGKTLWTVDRKAKEVLISKAEDSLLSRIEDYAHAPLMLTFNFDGKTLSCSFVSEADGVNADFKAEGISVSSSPADSSAFIFDVSKLGPEWIITDLR